MKQYIYFRQYRECQRTSYSVKYIYRHRDVEIRFILVHHV